MKLCLVNLDHVLGGIKLVILINVGMVGVVSVGTVWDRGGVRLPAVLLAATRQGLYSMGHWLLGKQGAHVLGATKVLVTWCGQA